MRASLPQLSAPTSAFERPIKVLLVDDSNVVRSIFSRMLGENDEIEILANDFPVARGQVIVQGKRIQVEVTSLIRRPEVERMMASARARDEMDDL